MRITHYTHPFAQHLAPFFARPFAHDFNAQIDRLFGAAFPVDLYEDKDNTYVRAELPGIARGDINVEVVEDVLEITATRKSAGQDGASESVTLKRRLRIPEHTAGDKISAACENGILTVTLPRKEQAKPRKFTVSVN